MGEYIIFFLIVLFFCSQLNIIQMDVTEALSKITAQTEQIKKIGTEVQAVKDQLAAAIEAGMSVPTSLADAINGMGVEIQVVDDLNEDVADVDA